MKTELIISKINNHFIEVYKNASNFAKSTNAQDKELWEFCINTVKDPIKIGKIVFANDLGIPPVRSALEMWRIEKKPKNNFKFTGQQSQWLGCFYAFVFKNVLGYKNQKERCTVGTARESLYGIKTATKFLNGEIIDFE